MGHGCALQACCLARFDFLGLHQSFKGIFMKKYGMLMDCGCCEAELLFSSDEDALQAVREVGLMNGAKITDASGHLHEGLDTFYGIWLIE